MFLTGESKMYKRILLISLLLIATGTFLYSEEMHAKKRVSPATSFRPMFTVLGIYMPNNDMMEVDIPYFMPMASFRFTHRFTDFGKKPEFSFVADSQISPLWIKSGAYFDFNPFNFISLSAGGDIGSSWGLDLGFVSMNFIGYYDYENQEYEYYDFLTHWVYDAWVQIALKYDFGALLTKGKTHIMFESSYRSTYKAMTGVENGEIWLNQGSGEEANGFTYNAKAAVKYMIPNKYFKSVGIEGTAWGYYSDCFFYEEYHICQPDFVNLTFALTASANIGYKNQFMLRIPVSGKRDFDCEKDLRPITEPDGRKWEWDGIILTYTHIF